MLRASSALVASGCAAALLVAAPCRADEAADLAAGVEAFRAADFATAVRLLEPLGDAPALTQTERARALGTLGLCLLATGDRERAVAPLRRLAILAPGVRLGTEELAPEYRAFFEDVRREVLSTVRLTDRTRAIGRGRARFEAVVEDPLAIVVRVEARLGDRAIALGGTDLSPGGRRTVGADTDRAPGRYRIVALARDRTDVARTDARLLAPVDPIAAPTPEPPPEPSPGHPWLWPTIGAAAVVAVVVVSVVLIAGTDPEREGCGSLGCIGL